MLNNCLQLRQGGSICIFQTAAITAGLFLYYGKIFFIPQHRLMAALKLGRQILLSPSCSGEDSTDTRRLVICMSMINAFDWNYMLGSLSNRFLTGVELKLVCHALCSRMQCVFYIFTVFKIVGQQEKPTWKGKNKPSAKNWNHSKKHDDQHFRSKPFDRFWW